VLTYSPVELRFVVQVMINPAWNCFSIASQQLGRDWAPSPGEQLQALLRDVVADCG
jgi:hypothetical protein